MCSKLSGAEQLPFQLVLPLDPSLATLPEATEMLRPSRQMKLLSLTEYTKIGHWTNASRGNRWNPTLGYITSGFPFKLKIPPWLNKDYKPRT